MNGPNAVLFRNSPDEPLILHDVQRIFNQTEWTGNMSKIIRATDDQQLLGAGRPDPVQVFLQTIVYTHAVLGNKTLFKESLMCLLVPLVHAFRNYQFSQRQQHLTVMYLALIKQVHAPVVKYTYNEEGPQDDFEADFDNL